MTQTMVVEDDAEVAQVIADRLRAQGYDVIHATTGREALAHTHTTRFDAITLDRMLPDMDGMALVARLRAEGVTTPVLMISSLGDVDQRIAGLRAGGDDYMVKPFAPDEVAMRVEVLLRRGRDYPAEGRIVVGPLEMDLIKRKVWLHGEPVALLQKEFRLLELLARHPRQILSRQMIFEQVWGYFFDPADNLINVHIGKLRRKLEQPGHAPIIETVKGEGYRLVVG
ncbi:response regulator transcription factor [Novosphingobium humi]|uniref:Response regulator transcription factor n=1 Tax=Novosphingobium humi TaxID=2282397 RepID=A0ABY7TZB8_9SPHN|nr:response regulator transcription factor [Novosphingobium humi]WCT78338.1 response regulator transcription factor [Novosphingobium humi]WJS98108.1 response regulator transcription factor [Novosphingobium humi]